MFVGVSSNCLPLKKNFASCDTQIILFTCMCSVTLDKIIFAWTWTVIYFKNKRLHIPVCSKMTCCRTLGSDANHLITCKWFSFAYTCIKAMIKLPSSVAFCGFLRNSPKYRLRSLIKNPILPADPCPTCRHLVLLQQFNPVLLSSVNICYIFLKKFINFCAC